jgi:hypothetical protein
VPIGTRMGTRTLALAGRGRRTAGMLLAACAITCAALFGVLATLPDIHGRGIVVALGVASVLGFGGWSRAELRPTARGRAR